MVEFAALETSSGYGKGDMVAGQRYATADGGGGAGGSSVVENGKGRAWYFGFISSFMLETGGAGRREKGVGEGGEGRERPR